MRVVSPRFPAAARPVWFAIVLPTIAFLTTAFLATGWLSLGKAAAADSKPAIVLVPQGTPRAYFEVRGLPADVLAQLRKLDREPPRWPQIFQVSVPTDAAADSPAMLGTYDVVGETVRFTPRFPLDEQVAYRASFDWQSGSGRTANRLRLVEKFVVSAARTGPPTRVAAIYPSGAALPENLLRFYLQFSAPMSQGNSYGYVHLRDEAGTEIDRPFLELPQELWSPDGTRLTLLFEPGRVKRGLVPRAEQGPILTAGHTYTLTVDARWPDATGRSLQAAAHKTFRASPAEMTQPDPKAWKIDAPAAASREPLSIRFPRPLDHAMLQHMLRVIRLSGDAARGADRTEVLGTIQIDDEERRWRFVPRDAWVSAHYALVVATTLEDRAGNSIGRPFEVDLNQSPPSRPVPPVIDFEFDVRSKLPHREGTTTH